MTGDDGTPQRNDAPEVAQWAVHSQGTSRIVIALLAVCAILLVADYWIHKHGPFAIEYWWGFYGIFAFVLCAIALAIVWLLRAFLLRGEDFYDR